MLGFTNLKWTTRTIFFIDNTQWLFQPRRVLVSQNWLTSSAGMFKLKIISDINIIKHLASLTGPQFLQ